MKIIDLSVLLRKGAISLVPGHPDFELNDFKFHEKDFLSNSFLQMSTHTGTHVDAPYHFIGDGITIDDLPLEKIVGPARVLDLRRMVSPKTGIPLEKVKQAARRKDLQEKIVILHSGWLKEKWGTRAMYEENPYLLPETARWLVDQKIKALGVDFPMDQPDQSAIPPEKRFPIHKIFLGQVIPHIENIANLEQVGQDEFLLVALPLKLYKCNGAPARVIAILD